MSYQDFLNTLVTPIQYFINWLGVVADSLISNYFVITLLGIPLFISMIYFIYHLILSIRHVGKFDADNVKVKHYILDRSDK